MKHEWPTHLRQSGRFIGFTTLDDTDRLLRSGQHFLFDLSHLAILRISGGDALSFLNKQLSNDVSDIAQTGCQLSAWCNPRGQVISNFILINTGRAFYILLPADLAATVAKRLAIFTLRAQVRIEDLGNQYLLLGANNSEPLHHLCPGETTDLQPGKITAGPDPLIITLPEPLDRLIILSQSGDIPSTRDRQPVFLTDALSWQYLDIKQGIPFITATTSEQFLPQMLNLDLLAALNLGKGCFPGQEIIARLHYRGTLKRRTIPATTEAEARAGDTVSCNGDSRPIGTILSAVKTNRDKTALLIALELKRPGSGQIHLSGKPGCSVTLEPLPYPINPE